MKQKFNRVRKSVLSLLSGEEAMVFRRVFYSGLVISLGFLLIVVVNAQAATPFDNLQSSPTLVIPETAMTLPALHLPFTDPNFGVSIMKVADASQVNLGRAVRHDYAKVNPFNANSTYAIFRVIGDGSWWLYNTTTWNPIRELTMPAEPEPRWSPTDPDTVYFVNSNQFQAYHPSTNTYATLHTFTQCSTITDNDEGNLSADGTKVAFICGARLIVYTIPTDTVNVDIPFSTGSLDWLSISPSGKYVVGLGPGVIVYNATTGALLRTLATYSAHADMGFDINGDEIIVMDAADDPTASNHYLVKWRLSDGLRTNVLQLDWTQSPHISMRNTKVPGWALVSLFRGPTTATGTGTMAVTIPFDYEIFFVATDGSGSVRRVAHHRTRHPDSGALDDYWNEPHATSNAEATKIVYASPWVVNGVATDLYKGQTAPNAYVITLSAVPNSPPPNPPTGLKVN